MSVYPLIMKHGMTGGIKRGDLVWLDSAHRDKWLENGRAREWSARHDPPLEHWGPLPADYNPPKKSVAEKVKEKVAPAKKADAKGKNKGGA